MRRRAVFSLIASCALAACTHQTSPQAMPGMAWSLHATKSEGAKLAFGLPQSDNVLVMLSCQPGSGEVQVLVNAAAPWARPALRLASRGEARTYRGEASPSGLGDGTIIEVKARASDPVFASFAQSGDLSVATSGQRAELPRGDRATVRRFVEGCRSA